MLWYRKIQVLKNLALFDFPHYFTESFSDVYPVCHLLFIVKNATL